MTSEPQTTLAGNLRKVVESKRMLLAERLLLWAMNVAPVGHPHAVVMARHLNAYSAEMRPILADALGRRRNARG